jgi:hypothetical protein
VCALKNPSPRPVLNPRPLGTTGKHTKHDTTEKTKLCIEYNLEIPTLSDGKTQHYTCQRMKIMLEQALRTGLAI